MGLTSGKLVTSEDVKNVEERSAASLLSLANKVFEKLVNNRLVDHLDKPVSF